MSSNEDIIIPPDTAEKISEALIKWLTERFEDGTIWRDVQPLLDVVIRVGVRQGIEEAERLLEGVASDKPYASWRAVIENATIDERIKLMEVGRQQAISDRVREIQAQKEWYGVLKTAIQVLVSILVALI
jgi:hypothetical protein